MTIISFFTSCITKATSELSERSWACRETKVAWVICQPSVVERSRTGLNRADSGEKCFVVQRALQSRDLRGCQWAMSRSHVSWWTLHDTGMSYGHTALPASPSSRLHLPARPQLKRQLSMEPSLMLTFHHRQTVRNRKTSKQESDASSRDFRETFLAIVGMVHERGQV